ncbi:MAG: histidine phosphatase family protein [Capsulimonadales bacterium]|nr:histidine phosphatase family protein [Capsulimonadales bacterium]
MNRNDLTSLTLIRHGQAIVNIEPVIGGMKGDRGLTPLGVRQAERLRDRLRTSGELTADVFLTSSLPRARQTAEILAPVFDVPPVADDDLQEFRTGPEGDGLPLAEYKKRFGWIDMERYPFTPTDPGGESWAVFMLRVHSALVRILEAHAGKRIVIVCHGGVVDASFFHFFGLHPFSVPATGFDTRNTSLTVWKQIVRHDRARWVLDRYNDDAHLRGSEVEPGIDYLNEPHAAAPVPTEASGE